MLDEIIWDQVGSTTIRHARPEHGQGKVLTAP